MRRPLHSFFTEDHRRLDNLLNQATKDPHNVEMTSYSRFRTGLLKHIKMEETILFTAAQKHNGSQFALIPKLRLDHGALTALMVPSPSPKVIRALRFILEKHDLLEEETGGLYDACDALSAADVETILHAIKNTSEVPVHAHRDEPYILEATHRALARAGYNFNDFNDPK